MRTTVPGVRTLVLLCTLFLSTKTFSQSLLLGNGKAEFGVGIGPMFFLGDLGGSYGEGKRFLKDLNIPTTHLVVGLYANVYPTDFFGIRVAANYGTLEGDDALTKRKGGEEEFRFERNQNFKTSVGEAYIAAEFYPTVFLERYEEMRGKLRPYGVAGVGMIKFNPKGKYYNGDPRTTTSYKWVDIAPLRLEGEGMAEYPDRPAYKLSAVEFPLGVGVKYYVKENMFVGIEVMHRKSTTDKIDGVSTNYIDANLFDKYLTPEQATMAKQMYFREPYLVVTGQTRPTRTTPGQNEVRGNPKQNDSFFSPILRFGWRLEDPNSPGGRASRQMRCPSFY